VIVIEIPASDLPLAVNVALTASLLGWLPDEEDRFRPAVPASR